MKQEPPQKKYLSSFEGILDKDSRKTRAFDLALDIRKFEIELYWKRATYFWAFTAAAVGAYITVSGAKNFNNREEALLLVCCLGLVFATAWYFVNRASKHWQNNWEKHVDLLEGEVIGPLYKIILTDGTPSIWRIEESFPFSCLLYTSPSPRD